MSKYLIAVIFLFSTSAHADVVNGLGSCLFNTTNTLAARETDPKKRTTILDFQAQSLKKISQTCSDIDKVQREICHINHLLEVFGELEILSSNSKSVIAQNIDQNGLCLYLTLFK